MSTTTDDPITLLEVNAGGRYQSVVIVNESGVPGAFSIDGGGVWCRFPDGAVSICIDTDVSGAVMFQRVAGGANATGLYAWVV